MNRDIKDRFHFERELDGTQEADLPVLRIPDTSDRYGVDCKTINVSLSAATIEAIKANVHVARGGGSRSQFIELGIWVLLYLTRGVPLPMSYARQLLNTTMRALLAGRLNLLGNAILRLKR